MVEWMDEWLIVVKIRIIHMCEQWTGLLMPNWRLYPNIGVKSLTLHIVCVCVCVMLWYSVFQGFRQAKSANGGSILTLCQFLILPQLPQKMKLASKVVKVDSKIIISLPKISIPETHCSNLSEDEDWLTKWKWMSISVIAGLPPECLNLKWRVGLATKTRAMLDDNGRNNGQSFINMSF